jgi:predicted nucleic acid-binding protein
MLIALERKKQKARGVYERLFERGATITVPWIVVSEWWRGRTDVREDILRSVEVEMPATELERQLAMRLAKIAGEALAALKMKPSMLADALVMASAALRGDIVITGDVDDLEKFRGYFPSVKVISIGET